ncbi:unnamed protein product [Sphenostylis stenocarpa]|uniref:Nudix hydrolase domain-containing protein n=1 Tax=Sphenostylis stenocarpa TaxID=92480 RepID=A0AA86VLD9_9FABA|nr:unnamed protein product [Sphenostylis stenocarpa]
MDNLYHKTLEIGEVHLADSILISCYTIFQLIIDYLTDSIIHSTRLKFIHQRSEMQQQAVEHLDVLTETGLKTGVSKPRGDVHRDGDYHRAVHVWVFAERTQELLLQRRASCKDSWPDLWDISSAGHISAGDSSLTTARRELEEELGVILPKDAFELLFVYLQHSVINDGKYINNEFNDVYLVTTLDPIPMEAFALQECLARRK